METSVDQQTTIVKYIESVVQDPRLGEAAPYDRPTMIQGLSRVAMGLPPDIDINDVYPPELQAELLSVIGGVRDKLKG